MVSNKLHNDLLKKQSTFKNNQENKKDAEWEKNKFECTFQPKYISKMYIITCLYRNDNVFQINPIQNDKLTKKKVEQFEKARIVI